jgi:hypothetical protein
MMRSTLTIDPDVAQLLAQAVARDNKPFKTVVNDALRKGLSVPAAKSRKRFKVTPVAMGWDPRLDPTGFNRLLDDLAVEDFLNVQQRSAKP